MTPTPKPGPHYNVPFSDYLQWDAVSQSDCKLCSQSPADYHAGAHITPTDDMIRGTGVDVLLFEGAAALGAMMAPRPEGVHPSSRLGKEFRASAEAAGVRVVSRDLWREIHECHEAILASPLACEALGLVDGQQDSAHHQLSLLWEDPVTGLMCKGRPDALRIRDTAQAFSRTYAQLGDLKVTRDPKPREHGGAFTNHIHEMRYHWQAGWYAWGVREAMGLDCDEMTLCAVQSKSRNGIHKVECHHITGSYLEQGEAECRRWLGVIAECQQSGIWPSSTGELHTVEPLAYQMR